MSPNPWLAIDAATPPAERAREVRLAWERFLGDGQLGAVRSPIAHSWRRSSAAGVDPSAAYRAPVAAGAEEMSERWDGHPLAAAARLIADSLGSIAEESAHLIVVSDADGLLLWIDGPPRVRMQAADSMSFTEGAMWSEAGAGTNAIGTALAADHAVQVFAGEHFNEVVQAWTCAAAPVHDPDTGALLGVIDLTGPRSTVHPLNLAAAVAAAQAVESYLRVLMHERDDRLRVRYADQLARARRQVLVAPSGRVLEASAEGGLEGQRLAVPDGGGELTLPDGTRAIAEPVGREEAFVVREIDDTPSAPRRPPQLESLARVLEAADEVRRSVVRDLHDGAQQRLVHTILTLQLAQRALGEGEGAAESLVSQALEQAQEANAELRELAHGNLPPALTHGGLLGGVRSLVAHSPLPVSLRVTGQRFLPAIEASVYFVVAEALTNVVKHSHARTAQVAVWVEQGALNVEVRDDGIGGARADGAGLHGLDDRIGVLGGQLRVESRPGDGTLVGAMLPLPA
jgi:signal transduction histidine kinase